jgi:hypothetical protein
MTRSLRRLTLLVALSAVSLLAIGAAAAAAHGGGGLLGPRGASAGALVTKAAANLGVSKAALTDAIEKAAATRIDEAVADGDLDEEDAADLKDAAGENLRLAMAVSRTRTVAANLSKTTAQLNTAFREARKALLLERIDEAVEDGDLDEDEAAELKEEVDEADLPGYKAGGFHHGPGARGLGAGIGPRGGFGHFAHRA